MLTAGPCPHEVKASAVSDVQFSDAGESKACWLGTYDSTGALWKGGGAASKQGEGMVGVLMVSCTSPIRQTSSESK